MSSPNQSFATALNCIDGRAQIPVNQKLTELFGASYIDTITQPGIVKMMAEHHDGPELQSLLKSINISLQAHGSTQIAIAAHHDCAANPKDEASQKDQLKEAIGFLRDQFSNCQVVGLWVSDQWQAEVLD